MINPIILEEMTANTGENLGIISEEQPVLIVFLRHFGCVFCKEALSDLAEKRSIIEGKKVRIVFVHMAADEMAETYFKRYELEGITHISDADQRYYAAFGVTRGSFSQLYGLRTWTRGYAASKKGHKLELAQALGDSTQMPGIFLLKDREIKHSYLHQLPSDRPNYEELLQHCSV